jgi:hypothetical protein
VNSPEEIVNYAKKIGLSGIAITDHNEIKGSLESLKFQTKNFSIIPGIEISSKDGHILALGIKEIIERDLSAKETVERIHELGGLAIATHPYDFFRGGVGDLIFKIKFDAIEVENGHSLHSYKNILQIAKEIGTSIIGGSDAHCLDEIGGVVIKVSEKYKNPMDAIRNSDVEVISRRSKVRILKNYLKYKYKKIPRKIFGVLK